MICFKDMTFCESNCANIKCHRNITEQVKEEAEKWWGSKDYPIATADFAPACAKHIPLTG